jgi:LmbE family N-acetylglucosaminyl deacetylase
MVSLLPQLLGRTLLIVAHPDDECIAYGTLLQRMREPYVVYATDGAPRDSYFWQKYGSRAEYAILRQQEARMALACAGVQNVEFLADSSERLGVTFEDQGLFRVLPQAFEALAEIVERLRPEALATLAYEGGHPDHDSCNLLTYELGKTYEIAAWEAPLYHREPGNEKGHVVQDFVSRDGNEEIVMGQPNELERKSAMCAAYPSQGDFLGTFQLEREIVRPLHEYDYTRPAHIGRLNYEAWQWPMTGKEVSGEFARFLQSRQVAKQPAT